MVTIEGVIDHIDVLLTDDTGHSHISALYLLADNGEQYPPIAFFGALNKNQAEELKEWKARFTERKKGFFLKYDQTLTAQMQVVGPNGLETITKNYSVKDFPGYLARTLCSESRFCCILEKYGNGE